MQFSDELFMQISGQLIGVYRNRNATDRFLVGYVTAADAQGLLMAPFTQRGRSAGACFVGGGDVFRVESQSQYLNNFTQRYALSAQPLQEGCPWLWFWKQAGKRVVHIRCSRTSLYGIPVRFDSQSAVLLRILSNGQRKSEVTVTRCDVILAEWGTNKTRSVEKKQQEVL